MKILSHLTFLFAIGCVAQCQATTYHGVAVDQTTGKPVEGLRILCRQFVVDHGLGNRMRAKVLGSDFADVDTAILDAVVTGADGTFTLRANGGTPMRSVSINKNGEYGIFNHNVTLARNMVIKIKDRPLRTDEGETDIYQSLPETVESGVVLFATYGIGNGYVFCLDSRTGKAIWKDRIFWGATTPVVMKNGRALVGTDGGFIFAYDIKTGQRLWECQTRQEVGTFQIDERSLYVGGGGNREALLVIDQETGAIRKTVDTDRTITGLSMQRDRLLVSSKRNVSVFGLPKLSAIAKMEAHFAHTPVVSSHSVLAIVRGPEDILISYDHDKLSPQWQQSFPRNTAFKPVIVDDSVVVPTGKGRRRIHVLDIRTGLSRWSHELDAGLSYSDIDADPSRIYLRTAANTIRSLSREGDLLWETDVGHAMERMELAVGAGRLFAVGRQSLNCLDARTGKRLWVYSSHDPYVRGRPTITDDGVFVTEEIGHVTRVSPDTGKAVWRFRCYGRIRKPVNYLKYK